MASRRCRSIWRRRAVSILWLDKRIRRPLDRLGHAIVGLGEGRPARAADRGGPREIRRLGENFDAMARKLDESEQERRALDESRQTLIADISHDLRTPITVISGYTSAIRDSKVPLAGCRAIWRPSTTRRAERADRHLL